MSEFFVQFFENKEGGGLLRSVMLFGALMMAGSIVAASFLDDYSAQYAANQGYGIDGTVTGSVKKTKRYTLQRSILSPTTVQICTDGTRGNC